MATTKYDGINWLAHAHVAKYSPAQNEEMKNFLGREPSAADWEKYNVTPKDTAEEAGNLLTTAGLQRVTNLIIGASTAVFGATTAGQAVVGVGSTATAATTGDTVLGANTTAANGSVGCWHQVTDSIPTAVNGVITAVSTFASADGNFAWAEWGWFVITGAATASATLANVGATSEQMINHKIAALGTKASGASWVFTTTVTLS